MENIEYIERKADLVTKIEAVDNSRIIRFIGSTENPDRSDDIVTLEGWETENYIKNPVFLWAHNYSIPPVGRTVNLSVDPMSKALVFDVYFPTVEEISEKENPSEHALFVDSVYKMYKNRLLNATSVGFRGKQYAAREDQADKPAHARGYRFEKQELLELSAVPVPANPEALAIMRSTFGDDVVKKAFGDDSLKQVENEVINNLHNEEKDMELENMVKSFDERLKALEERFIEDVSEKAGSKYSKETKSTLKACRSKLKECDEMIEKMVSDGVESEGNETSDGVEKPKEKEVEQPETETITEVVNTKSFTLDTPVSELENLRF